MLSEDRIKVKKIFNKIMTRISRRAKLLKLDGKPYKEIDYNIDDDIIDVLSDTRVKDQFIDSLINETDNDVVDFLLWMLDDCYKLSNSEVENKSIDEFMSDERFVKYRDLIFNSIGE